MKNLKYILFLFIIVMIACQSKTSDNKDNDYELAEKKAISSPIIETKLFGGFELGMSKKQVDSVFQVFVDSNKVVPSYEVRDVIAIALPPLEEKATIENYSYTYFASSIYPFNITFSPGFIDDKLVDLGCMVTSPNVTLKKENGYKFLADEFENSSRGENFKKYIGQTGEIIFIKDNLEIKFVGFPGDPDTGYILYSNKPLEEEYLKQEEQKKKDASML